jgi:hypoxanthine phosphoribosyltransferase
VKRVFTIHNRRGALVMKTVPLIAAAAIARRVRELGAAIADDYRGRPLTLVGVLNGAFIFTADLSRAVDVGHTVTFVRAASYGERVVSSAEVTLDPIDVETVAGRDVVLVEDIVDTGRTAIRIVAALASAGATSVKICSLLDKPERRVVDVVPDYVGFTVDDRFVVGYGLDYAQRYRSLDHIALLDPSPTS